MLMLIFILLRARGQALPMRKTRDTQNGSHPNQFSGVLHGSHLDPYKLRREPPIGVPGPAERRENDDEEGIPALLSDH